MTRTYWYSIPSAWPVETDRLQIGDDADGHHGRTSKFYQEFF